MTAATTIKGYPQFGNDEFLGMHDRWAKVHVLHRPKAA